MDLELAYIFTRPVGASIDDLLSQPTENSGLALVQVEAVCYFFPLL